MKRTKNTYLPIFPLLFCLIAMVGATRNLRANQEIVDTATATATCQYYGTVHDYSSSADCGFLIQLDDGTMLKPVEFSYEFELKDEQKVVLGYEKTADDTSLCFNAKPVRITCIDESDFDDTVKLRYTYQYQCISTDTCNEVSFKGIADTTVGDLTWKWMVNGAVVGREKELVYDFSGYGKTDICLDVSSSEGYNDFYCDVIVFDSTPTPQYKVDFVYSDTTDTIPGMERDYVYHLVDSSTGNISEWEWVINDSVVGEEPELFYQFKGPGTYQVCLNVFSEENGQDSLCKNIAIEGDTVLPCEAAFQAYQIPEDTLDANGPYTYQLTDGSKGNVTEWKWSVNGLEFSREQSPTCIFDSANVEYSVCLEVRTADGSCENSKCKGIVTPKDTINTCEAYFTHCNYRIAKEEFEKATQWDSDTISGDEGLIIGFKNQSSKNAQYNWYFGDSTTSSEKNPVHEYSKPGEYKVSLSITTPSGCTNAYAQSIKVGEPDCEVDFETRPLIADCQSFDVAYEYVPNLKKGTNSIVWDFGDGSTSFEKSPKHIYEIDQDYRVVLEVEYNDGCKATKEKIIFNNNDTLRKVVALKCSASNMSAFEGNTIEVDGIYPLPANDRLTFDIVANQEQNITIDLMSLTGAKTRLLNDFYLNSGDNKVEVELGSDLKTGIYIYLITTNDKTVRGNISIIN